MIKTINGWTKETMLKHLFVEFKGFSADEYGHCKYRGMEGSKCAVGIFIPDDKYRVKMEGNSISYLVDHPLINDFMPLPIDAMDELQRLHDLAFESPSCDRDEEVFNKLFDWIEQNVK